MSGKENRRRRRADLSQYFLRSRALAASLVAESSISANDSVIEIGPGRAILTRELARRCRRLTAVELDGELARVLRAEFSGNPTVEVVHHDFLRFELPHAPYKVFGNIPFARTADIVRRLVDDAAPPDEAYLIVQREAAERFAGTPYAPETLASLLLKPWWHVEIVRRLRRTDFDPPPSVDSVVLWLLRRDRPLVSGSEQARYLDFVTESFGRRGDSVARCVRGVFTRPQIARLARDLRFDPRAAPSALSFDQWLGLYRFGRGLGAGLDSYLSLDGRGEGEGD